ncbi:MAG: EAL domain-containing protein [Methylococcales bacterium]|nr:EAL domain-containing protein [Methylococcales bacterium]
MLTLIAQNSFIHLDVGLYRNLFESSSKGMMITNADNEIIHVNHSFTRITGYDASEVIMLNPRVLSSGRHDANFYRCLWEQLRLRGCWEGEIWDKRKNGEIFPSWQTVDALKNPEGRITHYLSVFSDIMPLKTTENELWKLAHHDGLTGLLNRRALEQRLDAEISAARRSGRNGILIFLDLDDFKKINDTLGHKAGDRLLVEVSRRLGQYLRKEDVFARLSGDEFVIMLTDLSASLDGTALAAAGVIRNMLQILATPFVIDGQALNISASFGVTFFHPFADTAEEALKQADTAMYLSKKHGKNTYTFYHPAMQEAADLRLYFETELRNAVHADQITLVYQPQYDQHQQLLGYEALARWNHPEKGEIMPSDFIAMAEETGIIIEMGEKILSIACAQMAEWQRGGATVPMLSINVSPTQFNHHNFVDRVLAIFKATEIDPAKITLEVTENLIISNVDEVIDKMNALKTWGVRFAIDDFGTGYSSLAYLKKLPIDQLKIDRSFIKDIVNNNNDAVIVNTILSMAEHLRMEIIAEGVENQAQNDHLIKSGCKGFQGYWLCPPLHGYEVFQSGFC